MGGKPCEGALGTWAREHCLFGLVVNLVLLTECLQCIGHQVTNGRLVVWSTLCSHWPFTTMDGSQAYLASVTNQDKPRSKGVKHPPLPASL